MAEEPLIEQSSKDKIYNTDELGAALTNMPYLNIETTPTRVAPIEPERSLFSAFVQRGNILLNTELAPKGSYNPLINNPLDYLDLVPERHKHVSYLYSLVTNEDERNELAARLDKELPLQKTIAQAPLYQSIPTGIAAAFFNPPTYASFLLGPSMGARTFGQQLLINVFGAAAATAMEEAYLSQRQVTRSGLESATNIASSAAAAGIITGLHRLFRPQDFKPSPNLQRDVKNNLQNLYLEPPADKPGGIVPYRPLDGGPKGPSGPGAFGGLGGTTPPPPNTPTTPIAADPNAPLPDNRLANLKASKKLLSMSTRNRMLASEFNTARTVADELFEHSFTLNKHLDGIASDSLETSLRLDARMDAGNIAKIQEFYFEQAGVKGGLFKESRIDAAAMQNSNVFDWQTYEDEIWNNIVTQTTSNNQQVNKASLHAENTIINKYGKMAVDLGILKPGTSPRNAMGYFPAAWNTPLIVAERYDFEQQLLGDYKKIDSVIRLIRADKLYIELTQALEQAQRDLKAATAAKDRNAARALNEKIKQLNGYMRIQANRVASPHLPPTDLGALYDSNDQLRQPQSVPELEAAVKQTTDNLTGLNSAAHDWFRNQLDGTPRYLNERALLLSQERYAKWQNRSITNVLQRYTRAMSPVLRMQQRARELGFDSVAQWKAKREEQLKEEYESMYPRYHGKEAQELKKRYQQQKDNIRKSFEMLLGIFGDGPNILDGSAMTALKAVRDINYVSKLGFQFFSALPEFGMNVLKHGPAAFVYDGVVPVLKDFIGVAKNYSKDDLNAMHYGVEQNIGLHLRNFGANEASNTMPNVYSRTMNKIVKSFGNVSLINYLISFQHNVAGTMVINQILKDIEAAIQGSASQKQIAQLSRMGIDKKHYKHIYKMWSENGKIISDNGTYSANYARWRITTIEEAKAFEAFRNAISKEIDQTVIIPGLGDIPDIMHYEIGKNLFQFKAYAFAAKDKILLTALDRNDANAYMGLAALVIFGMFAYTLVQLVRGNTDMDLSFNTLAKEGIDRGAIFGIYNDIFQNLNNIVGITKPVTRMMSRNKVSSALGPTVGTIADVAEFSADFLNSMRGGRRMGIDDYERGLKMLPWQNLFYTYYLTRKIIDYLGATAGIPPSKKRNKSTFIER